MNIGCFPGRQLELDEKVISNTARWLLYICSRPRFFKDISSSGVDDRDGHVGLFDRCP